MFEKNWILIIVGVLIGLLLAAILVFSGHAAAKIEAYEVVKGPEKMKTEFVYSAKENLKPVNLSGISVKQIDEHWKLYVGYVDQVNKLNKELRDNANAGKVASLAYADRRRRYGFEYNGMVLHEYYFENLKNGVALKDGALKKALIEQWGNFEKWQEDFVSAGKSRGIGWAILYLDSATGRLTNHFVMHHENGNIAGFTPILVMDVWEHAYMVDHGATERGDYIKAFLANIDWNVVENRYEEAR